MILLHQHMTVSLTPGVCGSTVKEWVASSPCTMEQWSQLTTMKSTLCSPWGLGLWPGVSLPIWHCWNINYPPWVVGSTQCRCWTRKYGCKIHITPNAACVSTTSYPACDFTWQTIRPPTRCAKVSAVTAWNKWGRGATSSTISQESLRLVDWAWNTTKGKLEN